MKRINVTADNLESEHICCAISDKRMARGVQQKKAWLQNRIEEGLVFKKLDVIRKVVENIPKVSRKELVFRCTKKSSRYCMKRMFYMKSLNMNLF
ncbi:hypothetical protein [Bacillus cereus group sp. BfR-BA-01380]|uniref:hypothetical protein n=1 Tax=Bacillus cereus group sp. BfR-BA-01380 TaxID=2920324 RepID=UPI001F59A89E|nr:hypothetical protein [Bacillus cereus group sp. BfR-BA-01380]